MKLNKLFQHFYYYIETYAKNKLGKGIMNPVLNGEYILLKKIIDNVKSPNIIDVGSNVGAYTKKAINYAKNKTLFIHSIDANPEMKNFFNEIDYPGFTFSNIGIGNDNSKLTFYSDNKLGGKASSSFYKHYYLDNHRKYEVDIFTIDQIFNKLKWWKADQFNLNLFRLTSMEITPLNKCQHSLDNFNYKIF